MPEIADVSYGSAERDGPELGEDSEDFNGRAAMAAHFCRHFAAAFIDCVADGHERDQQ
jgi:hypothetical protein